MFSIKVFAILMLGLQGCLSFNVEPLKPSENYTRSWIVDEDEPNLYQMFTKLVDNGEYLQVELHCKTTGWLGFGLSPNGNMPGADIAIAWIDNKGKAFLRDTHAVDKSAPLVDEIQDWHLIDAKKINGYTIFKIKRPLKSCDENDDLEIKKETNYLMFAWNQNIPVNNDWKYHGANRRIIVDMLLNYKPSNENIETEIDESFHATKIDFTLDNHPVKAQSTYYYCQFFEMDPFDLDQHLIRFEILVTKGNKDIVHHVVLHECSETVENATYGHECGSAQPPQSIATCLGSTIVAIWGVGGTKDFYFPPDTGYPIMKSNKKKTYLVEYHYDNPRLQTNRVDSSGIRLYFIPKTRTHDVGILNFGSGSDFIDLQMPPKIQDIMFSSICYPECSNAFFPDNGITVFAGFLHTHLAGRSVRTKLVRNNEYIRDVFYNPKYDFNYQFNVEVEPFQLYKNDTLIIECNYNTMGRDKITFWGFSTYDEMCYSFMYYYPKMPKFELCYSSPTRTNLENFYNSLIKDDLLPASVMNNETNYFDFVKKVAEELKKVEKFEPKLLEKYVEFFKNPGNQMATCGSATYLQDAIFNLEKPFPNPVNKIKEEIRICKKGFPLNGASPLIVSNIWLAILAFLSIYVFIP